MSVVVIGQVGRDLVLRTQRVPEAGGSEPVLQRLERLGGKGANQAVGLAQLGAPVCLIGVVGRDDDGTAMLAQVAADGIDATHVTQRGRTALLVTLVDQTSERRLLEHVPDESLLTVDDIERATAAIETADTVSLQLQQPAEAMLAAARQGNRAGARVLADGAVDADAAEEMLAALDVLRADATEAALWAGEPVETVAHADALATRLLDAGPKLVALAVPDVGDLLVWPGGRRVFPLSDAPVIDRTGAGDAFMAGLIAALRQGASPVDAGELATRAAGSTVSRLGGRPDLGHTACG